MRSGSPFAAIDPALGAPLLTLAELPRGQSAEVCGFDDNDPALEAKLREIGFAEGDHIMLAHTGPLSARPLCFQVNETLIALRPDEASAVFVELV